MRYFIDTEFIEAGRTKPVTLISICIVAEDGRTFYAVSSEFNPDDANDWVKANVLTQLGIDTRWTIPEIADYVKKFCDPAVYGKPEFWGYYADYDWVVFCQMFGAMINLPEGFPMYCNDLKQFAKSVGNPKLPEHGKGEHNALADARWNKTAYDFLMEHHEDGASLIADERVRQIDAEGWTAAHDDLHDECELLDAALCYSGVAGSQILDGDGGAEAKEMMLGGWPWDRAWWKPSSDPIRNLVKAGALIAAEIDRLQRKAAGGV